MIIEINDTVTIGDITDAFTQAFPFLSIEFFERPHGWGKASSLEQKIPRNQTIAHVSTGKHPGSMEIHGWQQTGAVEQEWSKLFGLYAQVFRRDDNAWVQTAGTDDRTLDQQNEAGRNASQELLDGTDKRFNNENPVNHE